MIKQRQGQPVTAGLQGTFWHGAPAPLRKGDRTSVFPACGKNGLIGEGSMRRQFATVPVALDGAIILCGCPYGTNRLIAPPATWFGPEKQPPYIPHADSMPTAEPEQFAQSAKSARPEPLPLPALIYQTNQQMDDDQASDMRHGDLDIATLRNRFHIDVNNVSMRVNPYTLKQKDPHDPLAFASPYVHPDFQPKPMPSVSRDESARILFDEFRELAKLFSFHGEYQHLITEMIAHMPQNSGKPWRSPLLDKALKEEIEGDLWRANIHYRVQDHFGLDDADVLNPLYREFRIFRLWFVLQRWNEYGFRPFITEMNATVTISGRRNG
jgi:uncharacterized Zn-binding protein involved in type VI secretion